jgi:RNA polymerase sigma factor (sigma-70 family)
MNCDNHCAECYAREYDKMIRYARKRLTDHGKAEDLVHDAFMNAFRDCRFGKFMSESSDMFCNFVWFRLVKWDIASAIRRDRTETRAKDELLKRQNQTPKQSEDLLNALEECLETLEKREREVVTMIFERKISAEQAAAALNPPITAVNVHTITYRAMLKLRKCLSKK